MDEVVTSIVAIMTDSQTPLDRTEVEPFLKDEPRKKPKSLSDWRSQVVVRDVRCVSCGQDRHVSAHHLIPKSHCDRKYEDDPRNGLTLCSEFSRGSPFANGCHRAVHEGDLKIRKKWLTQETIDCLKEQGLVWDDDGTPYGPGAHFFAKEESDVGR